MLRSESITATHRTDSIHPREQTSVWAMPVKFISQSKFTATFKASHLSGNQDKLCLSNNIVASYSLLEEPVMTVSYICINFDKIYWCLLICKFQNGKQQQRSSQQ